MTNVLRTPHRRRNLLSGDWVLVSPHRTRRPWLGKVEAVPSADRPTHDPDCYLCPGNQRVGGAVNPPYSGVYTFENDFPALVAEASVQPSDHPLLVSRPAAGTCLVVCFSERHDLTLGDMDEDARRLVIDAWADQTEILHKRYPAVQIFENKGAMMGASNPHPHGQIWAVSDVPTHLVREADSQVQHRELNGSDLLLDYADAERDARCRVVASSEHWLVVVPYWAVWPFETLVIPNRRVGRLYELNQTERTELSTVLGSLLSAYDRLFDVPFPYSMGWHQRPAGTTDSWVLHAHFNPPLLRSATVQKFMVGYEMFGEAQRDLTAEAAAERLREVGAPGLVS